MARRVLVVDDSAMTRRQVALALRGADFEVVEAADGADALEYLARGEAVSLVICDITMPHVTGIQLAQAMAHDPALDRVPVLILSASGDPYDLERAKGVGVKAWMFKPVDMAKLVATAKRIVAAAA
jgi:two-component system chemotaxis response regulator CheY